MMDQEFLTVGQLAKMMNVSVRTLQYYDKENILKPSAHSVGKRRLYTKKDIVLLHQILSFKSLGFTLEEIKHLLSHLNTPEDFIASLEKQKETIQFKINQLEKAFHTIEALEQEVKAIESVNLEKYADIIVFLQQKNPAFWVWKHFDETVTTHIKDHFWNKPEVGESLLKMYEDVLEQALQLQSEREDPASERSQQLAAKWWELIIRFTEGDMTLVPKLVEFSQTLQGETNELGKKQKDVDVFLEELLSIYITRQQIILSD